MTWHRYPETCGKTIEEVEELFSDSGPKPWHTKPGHSRLDDRIEEAREKNKHVGDVGAKSDTGVTVQQSEEKADV